VSVVEAPGVTHLTYDVLKKATVWLLLSRDLSTLTRFRVTAVMDDEQV
jgi:hypothetical protein